MNKIFRLIIVLVIAFFYHITAPAQGTIHRHGRGEGGSSTTTAMFGCNSGGCTGRGVCKSGMLKGSGGCPGTVFACNSQGTSFTITLDVTTLDTTANWVLAPLCRCTPGGTFTFDFPFDISVNCTAVPYVDTFNLPAGTIIQAGVAFPVTFATGKDGHQWATIKITPQTMASQTNYVMFGTPTDFAVNNQLQGIASIFSNSFTATTTQNTTATAIQTTFLLKPGAADTMVMVFRNSDLTQNQPLQASNFNFNTMQYGTNNTFAQSICLPSTLIGAQGIGLPANSVIPGPNNTIRISQSSDGVWDSIFVAYFPWQLPGKTYVQVTDTTILNIMYNMYYNAPTSSMNSWGWGTTNTYSYNNDSNNAQLAISLPSNGSGNPGWVAPNTNLNYYYTISMSYQGCTLPITLTSSKYLFSLSSQTAAGFARPPGSVEVRRVKSKGATKKKK